MGTVRKRFCDLPIDAVFEYAGIQLKKISDQYARQTTTADSKSFKKITSYNDFLFNRADIVNFEEDEDDFEAIMQAYNWTLTPAHSSGQSTPTQSPGANSNNPWSYNNGKDDDDDTAIQDPQDYFDMYNSMGDQTSYQVQYRPYRSYLDLEPLCIKITK